MDRAESEVLVPASPEETWEAITDPEHLGEWLAEDAEVELRPGGDLRIGLPTASAAASSRRSTSRAGWSSGGARSERGVEPGRDRARAGARGDPSSG